MLMRLDNGAVWILRRVRANGEENDIREKKEVKRISQREVKVTGVFNTALVNVPRGEKIVEVRAPMKPKQIIPRVFAEPVQSSPDATLAKNYSTPVRLSNKIENGGVRVISEGASFARSPVRTTTILVSPKKPRKRKISSTFGKEAVSPREAKDPAHFS